MGVSTPVNQNREVFFQVSDHLYSSVKPMHLKSASVNTQWLVQEMWHLNHRLNWRMERGKHRINRCMQLFFASFSTNGYVGSPLCFISSQVIKSKSSKKRAKAKRLSGRAVCIHPLCLVLLKWRPKLVTLGDWHHLGNLGDRGSLSELAKELW